MKTVMDLRETNTERGIRGRERKRGKEETETHTEVGEVKETERRETIMVFPRTVLTNH